MNSALAILERFLCAAYPVTFKFVIVRFKMCFSLHMSVIHVLGGEPNGCGIFIFVKFIKYYVRSVIK